MEELCWEMVSWYGREKGMGAGLTWRRNRGELAEGWYDPATLMKAVQAAEESKLEGPKGLKSETIEERDRREQRQKEADRDRKADREEGESSDSDESIGPALPGQDGRSRGSRMGPSIPGMQDLELKRGIHTIPLSVPAQILTNHRNGRRRRLNPPR